MPRDDALLKELEELVRRQTCWADPKSLPTWGARVRHGASPLLREAAGTLLDMIERGSDARQRFVVTTDLLRATAQLRTQLASSPASPTSEAASRAPGTAFQSSEASSLFAAAVGIEDGLPLGEPAASPSHSDMEETRTGRNSVAPRPSLRRSAATETARPPTSPSLPSVQPDTHTGGIDPAPSTSSTQPGSAAVPRRVTGNAAALTRETAVEKIPGIGAAHARLLERAGLTTAGDMLTYFPRRYDDYAQLLPVAALTPGMDVTVRAHVASVEVVGARGAPAKARRVVASFADDSGQIDAVWFNQPWVAKSLTVGRLFYVSGRIESRLGRRQFSSPQYEPADADREALHTGRLVPVYPLTAGLTNRWLRPRIKRVVDALAPSVLDVLPPAFQRRWELVPYPTALAQIHFPDDEQACERARRRIGFDEALFRQLALQRRKLQWKAEQPGVPVALSDDIRNRFLASLPFVLTNGQRSAADEILTDLSSGRAMARLLQGDVGSGKTVVAALACLAVAQHGYQSAMMAPTEILAEQHLKTLSALLDAFPDLHVELLTGSTPAAQRRAVLGRAATGQSQVLVGTHAVIQETVQFARLGLAIIDEQHRFGVLQRGLLQQKGYHPHLLVMSATPIPRTLERARYADLDVSVIAELPPGRTAVKTAVVLPERRAAAYRFIQKEVADGRQAFVICPLVEESDVIEARAATSEYERLQRDVFPDLRLALLHGRMRPTDKDRIMRAFREREFDLLVSTTVIEVGIDVPNASVMMIEGAERFGLSQLHQLRGRVGRGAHESYCMLLPSEQIDEATERLRIVEQTSDGFRLAEEDLRLRGPGDFYGVRQSGLDDLLDVGVITDAHTAAGELLATDPELSLPEHTALANRADQVQQRLVDWD